MKWNQLTMQKLWLQQSWSCHESVAEAARSATEANLDQLLPFLNFIQKKDKLFAFKVMYLPRTNKISAVFFNDWLPAGQTSQLL